MAAIVMGSAIGVRRLSVGQNRIRPPKESLMLQEQKIIRSAIKYYPSFEPNAVPADWARWTADAIGFFLPTFKNDAFEEEKEWRLNSNAPATRRSLLIA